MRIRSLIFVSLTLSFALAGPSLGRSHSSNVAGAADASPRSDKKGKVPEDTGSRNKDEATKFVKADKAHIKRADRAEAKLIQVSELLEWSIVKNSSPQPTDWPRDIYVWAVKIEGSTKQIASTTDSKWMVRIFGGTKDQPLWAIYVGDDPSVPGWESLPDHDPNG